MADLLTTTELAEMIGLSPKTIHMRRYRGASLPRSIKLGTNVIRYRREDVEQWLDEHSEPPRQHATDDASA